MSIFFPNNLENLVRDPQFRNLFVIDPMMVSTGIYYGFPACCIEHFCLHGQTLNNSTYQNHPMSGTGYVPCPHCLESSKDKDTFAEYINANRYCAEPFPSQQVNLIDVELHKFFALLCYKMYKDPLSEIKTYSKLSYLVNEIEKENPVYLYVKGYKINVTAIGIKDKENFCYMVENDSFCSSQLETIFTWHEIQEFQAGLEFPTDEIWNLIFNGNFNIIVYETEKPSLQHIEESQNINQNEEISIIKKQNNSPIHFASVIW